MAWHGKFLEQQQILNPVEMKSNKEKVENSKNFDKDINCNRCGKKVRNDRLKEHQKSRNCKTEHSVFTIDKCITTSFK